MAKSPTPNNKKQAQELPKPVVIGVLAVVALIVLVALGQSVQYLNQPTQAERDADATVDAVNDALEDYRQEQAD